MDMYSFLLALAFIVAMSVVVFLFLRDGERRRAAEYRMKAMSDVLPNRLQAYERLALYLNRISPDEMAIGEQVGAATAKDLYLAMVNRVRMEFEHNVAMQVYVSQASWSRVLRAKEEVIKTLGDTRKSIAPDATPLEFSAEFIEAGRNSCSFYVERAKEGLRKDVAGEFVNE